jgi:hypothetical protein
VPRFFENVTSASKKEKTKLLLDEFPQNKDYRFGGTFWILDLRVETCAFGSYKRCVESLKTASGKEQKKNCCLKENV